MTEETPRVSALECAERAFRIESEALAQMVGKIPKDAFQRAVEVLADAGRIGASACGHSGIACMHFAHLMCCAGLPGKFFPPSEAVHGGLGFLKEGDVMVLASRGGKTNELLPILDYCIAHHITVVSITENSASELAEKSDIVLPMHVNQETDRYNCQGTTSFIVLSSIFDALQAALIEWTGYQNERFAQIHPGGAVGQRLNRGKNI